MKPYASRSGTVSFSVLFLLVFNLDCGLAAQPSPVHLDLLAMQGTWVREDAPYRLEISGGAGGVMRVKYFNRKYINVEETDTAARGGFQYILIRLKDVNYPGSIYLLRYDRKQDKLFGIYTPGTTGQEFNVSFARKKPAG